VASKPFGRVLIVSPSFFGYEQDIRDAFARQADHVDLIDERPGNSTFIRAAARLGLPGLDRLVDRHFRASYAALAAGTIELALIVKGETTPAWFLTRLREDNPGIRIVYYAYDRIPAGHNSLDLIPLCDEAYSFDPHDVEHLHLRLKHLFAGTAFGERVPFDERPFDVSFVGTAHSDRYRYVTGVAAKQSERFLYFYSPARWFFAFQKYVRRELRAVPWSAVTFQKMPKEDVALVFARSRAVIDLQRTGQTGLTMRTFEVLASGARLITTNASIRDLDVFDEEDVLVLDPADVDASHDLVSAFVRRPRARTPEVEQYSIDSWVRSFAAPAGGAGS
jgi:hypothetical protein